MTPEEIQKLCIASTEAYLSFLEKNKRGLDRVNVMAIEQVEQQEKPVFKLTLGKRLRYHESVSLELKPPGRIYGPDYFRVLEYDGDAKVLIIQVQNAGLALDDRSAESLCVVSDLRFLVKNVKRWFESNGTELQLPRSLAKGEVVVPAWESEEPFVTLNECQRKAVTTLLANPLTYVWGPPGTGKTKHVLTEAVIQLLAARKRVAIFAPTNNALEQAMRAVLNAAERKGIGRDKFLRVGEPSTKFAAEFPEVCEVQGLQRRLDQLRKQIGIYSAVFHYRRGATVLGSVATLRHEISELQNLLSERRLIYEKLAHLQRNPLSRIVHSLRGDVRAVNDERTSLEEVINGRSEMIRLIQTESPQLNTIIGRIDFTNIEQIVSDIVKLQDQTQQYLLVNRAIAEEYEGQTNEEIQSLITDLEQQVKVLEAETTVERIKTASVVGMTLDCFIGRFFETFLPFDHIFLDEAGYAPLVKALTLCRGDIPLTFIGDHMQLGPVCEMNDENLVVPSNTAAIVWRKSALFIDDMFVADNDEALVARLFARHKPERRNFIRADLNVTFRFGQNLADILSECVYKDIRLISKAGDESLKITCLNAILKSKPRQKRENLDEVEAIACHRDDPAELESDEEEAFAILTPYIHQVTLLGNRLIRERRQDRIMNVHHSQGREWDTVILSVVDGPWPENRPWFTDSENAKSGGLYVINTAISRARKHLVLVCDKEFWLRPEAERQLISRLLRASRHTL